MTRLILAAVIFVALVAAAVADPLMRWGSSFAVLSECAEADACVSVTNNLGSSATIEAGALRLDWITVGVVAVMEIGDIPDTVTVTAPLGYIVDPPFAVIEEGATVVFRIIAPPMG